VGFAAAWRMDRSRISHGGSGLSPMASSDPRPRVLGAWPRPMGVQRQLISFLGTSVYFGSSQSLRAMGLSRLWGRWRLAAAALGCARRRSV
jgi:hypothetical protein